MSSIDKQYTDLLQDILDNGFKKDTRNGKVLSVFGRTIRHNMKNGFPLLTTKKMHFKGIVTELLWFLKGSTNIKYLVDNDCNIWNGDAFRNYCTTKVEKTPIGEIHTSTAGHYGFVSKEKFINKIKTDDEFANKWGDLGPIYGKQWRRWKKIDEVWDERLIPSFKIENIELIDQIANVINDIKTDPDSRRLLVTAWNPADLSDSVLPPCHYSFQFYTRELTWDERHELSETKYQIDDTDEELDKHNIPTRAISLMFNMRSTDVGLGLGFNLASYGLLLMMIAKQVNMIPDELAYNGGDVHLYSNHIEPIKEQLTRTPYDLPTVKISDRVVNDISEYTLEDFTLENYQSHPAIKMPLSN